MHDVISLDHGAGGTAMRSLINDVLLSRYNSPELHRLDDGARLSLAEKEVVFTTDSYVIQPLFFNGGDIGTIAVSGTVNDLLVMGSSPCCISVGMILEEGLDLSTLERIAQSIANTAAQARVSIVTGDTKVVPRGQCDQIFINTSGIGTYPLGQGLCSSDIAAGDALIVSGTIGDHAVAILESRLTLQHKLNAQSDCSPLTNMIEKVLSIHSTVKWMRDPTRGGLAAVLDELAQAGPFGIEVEEPLVPVTETTQAVCELLGYDPLHLANEGKVVMVVDAKEAASVLSTLRTTTEGKHASIIGRIVSKGTHRLTLKTKSGGNRLIHRPSGELLPRIC